MPEYITISLKLGEKELLKEQYIPIEIIPYEVLEELQAAIQKFVIATSLVVALSEAEEGG